MNTNYTGINTSEDGDKYWYLNGKLHREDGPAVEWANGDKEWWINGEYHREDGPAIEYASGSKLWYLNGKLHREDGPAIEWASGHKEWWINGEFHREDGPAIEYANGSKSWWINGKRVTENEILALSKISMKSTSTENKIPATSSKHNCPQCGSSGDDLVFVFYCSNSKCSNYKN